MNAPWDIYARELFPLGYGHPVWGPEPSLEYGEVQLGDVGYLREGRFCFLFNSLRAADAPVHSELGVPEEFHIFNPPNLIRRHRPCEITQRQLHSKNLQSSALTASVSAGDAAGSIAAGAGVRYRCSEESGALLMLKHAGHKTYIDCQLHIKKYMKKNMARWSYFANTHLGVGIEDKDIIFVSGFIKTPAWGEVAFTHRSTSGELLVSAGCLMPPASGEFQVSLDRCAEPSVFCRSGPAERIAATGDATAVDARQRKDDQCVFINYYKMKSRIPWGMGMQAAAGPHQLPPGSDDDPQSPSVTPLARTQSHAVSDVSNTVSVGGMSMYGTGQNYDPVDEILEYILEKSDATIAFASDMDAAALIQYLATPEDVSHVLETRPPKIIVDEDGVGTINPASDSVLPDDLEMATENAFSSRMLARKGELGIVSAANISEHDVSLQPDKPSKYTVRSLVRKVTKTLSRQSGLKAFRVKGSVQKTRLNQGAREKRDSGSVRDSPVIKPFGDLAGR